MSKRKHVATGKPRGGKREGAGRPEGATSPLPKHSVSALRSLSIRVPDDAPEALKDLAAESLGRIVDVMRGDVWHESASAVLQAAKSVREELLGPIAKKHEVAGPGGTPVTITIHRTAATPAPATPEAAPQSAPESPNVA